MLFDVLCQMKANEKGNKKEYLCAYVIWSRDLLPWNNIIDLYPLRVSHPSLPHRKKLTPYFKLSSSKSTVIPKSNANKPWQKSSNYILLRISKDKADGIVSVS